MLSYIYINNIVIIHIIDMILQIIHALTYQQLRDSIHSHAKPPAVGLLAQYMTIHILLYTDYYTYRLLHIVCTHMPSHQPSGSLRSIVTMSLHRSRSKSVFLCSNMGSNLYSIVTMSLHRSRSKSAFVCVF